MKVCSLLWRQLYVSENGSFYPCCLTRGNDQAEFLDENGMPIRVSDENSISKAWNSPTIQGMRSQMLEGKEPEVCGECFSAEKMGDRSLRVKNNEVFLSQMKPMIRSEKVPESEIRALDVRWGNICNLKCRMCYPDFSRLLLPEHQEIYGRAKDPKEAEEILSRDWFRRGNQWKEFPELENLEFLNFAGGEPLLIPESFELLERLVKSGKSKQITLTYNTNLTVLPAAAKELWPQFKEVKVSVSLDGYKEVNSYIRYPSSWEKIEKNLQELDQNFLSYGLSHLSVHSTLQIYNVFSFGLLLDWMKRFSFLHPYPDITYLTSPEHFDLRVLPKEAKFWAEEALMQVLPKEVNSPHDQYFHTAVMAAIQTMNSEDRSHLWSRFLEVTQYFDRKRSQAFPNFQNKNFIFPFSGTDPAKNESASAFLG